MENKTTAKKGKTVIIYNCKKCKKGRRVEYTADGVRMDSTGKFVLCGIWIKAIGGGLPTQYGGDLESGICECGKMMAYGELNARVVADITCGGKCRSSRGPSCDCSCGGVNHGCGH